MKYAIAFALIVCTAAAAREPRWPRPPPPPPPPVSTPAAAAIATANGPTCSAIRPFYFEVGMAGGKVASGSVGGTTYGPDTVVGIASASKIFYAAYVAQKRAGVFTPEDVKLMTFVSGYSQFSQCRPGQTVSQCANGAVLVPSTIGKFAYSGGHMERHAADVMGLGALKAAPLAAEVNATIGTKVSYSQPQPAGGISTSATETAAFLRAVMVGRLSLGAHLADYPVATQGPTASNSPVPEAWHYGIGHWIEDGPGNDGAFSSPGAFGFYPWIAADRQSYGIISRKASSGAWSSVKCGREIRKAFATGVAR